MSRHKDAGLLAVAESLGEAMAKDKRDREHIICKCRACLEVVAECPCPSEKKTVRWTTCPACAGRN